MQLSHTENVLYTITELTSTLTAHSLPPLPGVATLLSSTSSLQLPPGEPLGNQLASELLLASALTADGQIDNSSAPFLYATNRNDPSAEGDTLAIFSLEDPNTPSLVAEVHTGLQQLRGAAIVGENEQYIVMGGQTAGGVKVFERVDGGRSVKELAALPDIQAPTGFVWF
jgi:6-phosphogluconolactonase (cycloisomerase 2 family)